MFFVFFLETTTQWNVIVAKYTRLLQETTETQSPMKVSCCWWIFPFTCLNPSWKEYLFICRGRSCSWGHYGPVFRSGVNGTEWDLVNYSLMKQPGTCESSWGWSRLAEKCSIGTKIIAQKCWEQHCGVDLVTEKAAPTGMILPCASPCKSH